ncbi:hypothetical protein [Actinacidiphila acidipaludis]|uniref:Uncharacterized protein n=1 Tax=Actinacidiphila acidipaludis TaxID=2873382 RepID=A0ABS7QGJ9_9ACTN|nr:hypothetical protein [Streptomyces acidipaludis]MBY8882282.1 hypothetical protein [Streptomyces acidipaludis]
MLAAVGAVILAIAYLLNVTSTHTDAAFSPFSLLVAGAFFVALHLAGFGPRGGTTSGRRRWRR